LVTVQELAHSDHKAWNRLNRENLRN